MSNRTRLLIDVAALVALLLADNPALTGIAVHEWLSVALAGVIFVHLVLNWDWCLSTAKRFLRKMLSTRRVNLVIDTLLMVSFVAVTLSGLMISKVVLGALGIHQAAAGIWRGLHSLSATTTIALFAAHLGMHARWILNTATRMFARKASAAVAPATGVAGAAEPVRSVASTSDTYR